MTNFTLCQMFTLIILALCLSACNENSETAGEENNQGPSSSAFITQWNTAFPGISGRNSVSISLNEGGGNFVVDWGDGMVEEVNGANTFTIAHTYVVPGIYSIAITGEFPGFYFSRSIETIESDSAKLASVEQWGDVKWTSMENAFVSCFYVVFNASDTPDLSQVTSMENAFRQADSINSDLSQWDVSNVTNMKNLFTGADLFNGDISQWDVSNVTNMSGMFALASAFNGNISQWDVSNVTDMSAMFAFTSSFNQDLNLWNVANVTNMNQIFDNAEAFNGNVSSWTLTSAINMKAMFKDAVRFNGNIGEWDVTAGRFMSEMFFGASAFNQDLSQWDISGARDLGDLLSNSAMSTENYDALLVSWSNLNVNQDVPFGASNISYSNDGAAARAILVDSFGWVISDAGLAQ